MISNCGSDENGNLRGGKPGDQNGKEWRLRPWYSYPWTHVIRAKDKMLAKSISLMATLSALNDNIGYNQDMRLSYYDELKRVSFNPGLINVKCDADCSSGVSAIVKSLLHIRGIAFLETCTTRNILDKLLATNEFIVLTDRDYLNGKSVQEGDILLAINKHVAIWCGDSSSNDAIKVAPAKQKNTELKGNYVVDATTAYLLNAGSPSAQALENLHCGDEVKCYGYHTGDYLYVTHSGAVGYVKLNELKRKGE